MRIGLIVPVLYNFTGFAHLMGSVDAPVLPIVIPNWIRNDGVSKGWNLGLELAVEYRCDLALVANDDVILHPGAIDTMRTAVWNHGYDLVSPIGDTPHEKPGFHPEADYACFMVQPEEFLNKFGRFDEAFSPAYFEDNDMRYRIKLAGGREAALLHAGMIHAGSITQNWMDERVVSHEMFRANEAYYIGKWGGRPGQERFTTPYGN